MESRVGELENENMLLKQSIQQLESSKTELLEAKNMELNIQRIKLKRYEFAISEAILFLKKPTDVDFIRDGKRGRAATGKGPAAGSELSEFETNCLELIKYAHSYLLKAQEYAERIEKDPSLLTEPIAALKLTENESLALQNAPRDSNNSISSSASDKRLRTSIRQEINYEFNGDVGISNEAFARRLSAKCPRCSEIQTECDALLEKLTSIHLVKSALEAKLQTEEKLRKRIQKSKDMMDQELEDLTSTLFSQANHMVIAESKIRDDMMTKNKELTKRVLQLSKQLDQRESDLSELKEKLYLTQGESSYSTQKSLGDKDGVKLGIRHTIISGFDEFRSFLGVDGILLTEFQDFMKSFASISSNTSDSISTLFSTNFLKRCFVEDIEPCLFYTYQANSSFKNVGTPLHSSLRKRLLEIVSKNQFEIHLYMPEAQKDKDAASQHLGHRSKTSYACKAKCFNCAINRDCEYVLTTSTNEKHTICRFCRDRITSVSDFYSFIGYLCQGIIGPGQSGATILSLFKHVMWLRRRMHQSQVGSCSIFETELSAIMGPEKSVEWEKLATIIQ
jgi:hypothetical protein